MTNTELTIRLADPSDAHAIADIYNEAIRTTTATFDTEPKTPEDRLLWLSEHDDRHPVLVGEVNGQVVGWAALTEWSDRPAYSNTAETSFYVSEKYRGKGIGRQLKERLLNEARQLGFYTLLARMAEESLASIHINESLGFRRIGTMKEVGSKFGRRLDVHMMQLMLNDPVPSNDSSTKPAASSNADVETLVVEGAIASFQANRNWADQAIAQLADDRLRIALDGNTNSIAVIMKHVSGNLQSRWTDFLTTDGEKVGRNRDDEFVDTFASQAELLSYWEQGWTCLFDTLSALTPENLSETITIRGEPHSVPLAIQRSLAHCGYHIGQIVMIARILAGDEWETITIPRGKSSSYNQQVWGQGHYKK